MPCMVNAEDLRELLVIKKGPPLSQPSDLKAHKQTKEKQSCVMYAYFVLYGVLMRFIVPLVIFIYSIVKVRQNRIQSVFQALYESRGILQERFGQQSSISKLSLTPAEKIDIFVL